MKYPVLEEAIRFRGLRKYQLSYILGFSDERPAVRRLNGEAHFTVEEALKLAEYFGKSVEELFRTEEK